MIGDAGGALFYKHHSCHLQVNFTPVSFAGPWRTRSALWTAWQPLLAPGPSSLDHTLPQSRVVIASEMTRAHPCGGGRECAFPIIHPCPFVTFPAFRAPICLCNHARKRGCHQLRFQDLRDELSPGIACGSWGDYQLCDGQADKLLFPRAESTFLGFGPKCQEEHRGCLTVEAGDRAGDTAGCGYHLLRAPHATFLTSSRGKHAI